MKCAQVREGEGEEGGVRCVRPCLPREGPYTYDVLTVGGGVGSEADNALREWDSDKGGGSKNPIFLRMSYVNGP